MKGSLRPATISSSSRTTTSSRRVTGWRCWSEASSSKVTAPWSQVACTRAIPRSQAPSLPRPSLRILGRSTPVVWHRTCSLAATWLFSSRPSTRSATGMNASEPGRAFPRPRTTTLACASSRPGSASSTSRRRQSCTAPGGQSMITSSYAGAMAAERAASTPSTATFLTSDSEHAPTSCTGSAEFRLTPCGPGRARSGTCSTSLGPPVERSSGSPWRSAAAAFGECP